VFKSETFATKAESQEFPEEEIGCMNVSDQEKEKKNCNLSETRFCVSTEQQPLHL